MAQALGRCGMFDWRKALRFSSPVCVGCVPRRCFAATLSQPLEREGTSFVGRAFMPGQRTRGDSKIDRGEGAAPTG